MSLTYVCVYSRSVDHCWILLLQANKKVVTIDGYEDVSAYDEKALKKAVAHQPVSVAIEAGGRALQLYESVSHLKIN